MRKDGKDDAVDDFRGKSRSNVTHEASTHADSRLFRKGKTANELRFMGHTIMENHNGLIVNAMVTQADGHAKREAAKSMISYASQAMPEGEITRGADQGYGISMEMRKLIAHGCGWAKFIGPICKLMVRGIKKVDQVVVVVMADYNLVRMRALLQGRLEVA